jgi:DNA-binding MarR family transcriptional regulator
MEMMNDLEKNKKEIDAYKLSSSKGTPNGIKFNIQVISQSAWEISKKNMEKIELPKFLLTCKDDFEKFYINKHSGHKLIWCFGLSKMEVQFLFLKNRNICICTLPQLLTLLELEKNDNITIKEISERLGCAANTILTDIHGLVFNPSYNPQGQPEKGVILGTYDKEKKEFKESDQISINRNFVVPRQKFQTLPLPIKKTAAEVKEAELEETQIMKKYQDNILQATLTRIMKSRIGQTTTHVWLISEAAKQIDLFKAQPQQIKENIEKLIEKSIIKRNEKNRTCYEYIY